MKRIFTLFAALLFVATASAQVCTQTYTQSLQLYQQGVGCPVYGPGIIANWNMLDAFLGGRTILPALFWQNAVANNTRFGSVKLFLGSTNTTAENASNKGQPYGYPPLDSTGVIPESRIARSTRQAAQSGFSRPPG